MSISLGNFPKYLSLQIKLPARREAEKVGEY